MRSALEHLLHEEQDVKICENFVNYFDNCFFLCFYLDTRQPPAFRLSKITVNAKLMLQAINEIEPLLVWRTDSSQNHTR